MKRSKLCMTLLVVVLILSFTVTTVGAQTQPPVGELDGDSDEVLGEVPEINDGDLTRPDLSQFKTRFEDYVPSGDLPKVDVTPYPIGPQSVWIFNKTPKFYFYEYGGATSYRIAVYNITSGSPFLVYEFTGPPACSSGICWLKPTTALKVYDIANTKGIYAWAVRAKAGGSWQPYTGYVHFGVISKGFNSTFDINMNKWLTVRGDWARVDPGYLKSTGLYNAYTSVIRKEYFTDDYVITARMKGKTGTDQYQGIIIGGYPYALSYGNVWYDGAYFLYCGGFAGILLIRDGAEIVWSGWEGSAAIDPIGWNKLEVQVDSPNAYFRINGYLIWVVAGFPQEIEPGYVGLAHVKYIADKAPLLVDWAKLSYPSTAAMAEMERDLGGAKVIDLNNLPPMVEGAGPLEPPQ